MEEEKVGSIGVIVSNLAMVLTLLSLAINYSSSYVEKHPTIMIVSCILTVIIFGYQGIWQIRYVKCLQKSNPRLQGDPGCMKQKDFQKAWLSSCDEAERELIYQSGYEAYIGIMRIIPMCSCGNDLSSYVEHRYLCSSDIRYYMDLDNGNLR